MPRTRSERGQAAVELVAVLPVVALLAALAWQAVLVGQAAWLAGTAARAAARARLVGGDPAAAARRVLPPHLRAGLTVRRGRDDGEVRVRVGVPSVAGGRLGALEAAARLGPRS